MTENERKEEKQQNRNPIQSIVASVREGGICPICLTTVSNRALTDTCSHEFCFDCIKEWSQSHNRCPICRQIYSNIKYNVISNESFELLAVEEQPEVEEEEIEAILNRMLLYLRLIGLRNRSQRQRDQLLLDMNYSEERVKELKGRHKEVKEIKAKMEETRAQIRQLDEEINRFNQTLSAESPTIESLREALDGREEEIQDIEVIDIIFDPDQLQIDELELPDQDYDSFESLPDLISDDSGNESDDEQSEEEQNNTRKRKPSSPDRNSDSNGSGQSSPKRKRNRRH